MVSDPLRQRNGFAVWQDDKLRFADKVENDLGRELVPYAFDHPLMRSNVMRFPVAPEAYGSVHELVGEVREFVNRYVGLSDGFDIAASYYVLFTWLYDGFNDLPYLRVTGDYGSGKTRFLHTIGSVCYRPIFASGASTLSPIFHLLDEFGGTLILDEGDFRLSDETADMVKLFNSGNTRGMPILRSQMTRERTFEPRVFNVFGPKIVATRGRYDDRGLESRFLTERMSPQSLHDGIPVNLPEAFEEQAARLRNKLLMYRFKTYRRYTPQQVLIKEPIEPRLQQVLAPLLSIIDDDNERDVVIEVAQRDRRRTPVSLPGHDGDDVVWVPV